MTERNQLAQYGTPLDVGKVGADTEGRQAPVPVLLDLIAVLATQHVDQVRRAIALTTRLMKAVNTG